MKNPIVSPTHFNACFNWQIHSNPSGSRFVTITVNTFSLLISREKVSSNHSTNPHEVTTSPLFAHFGSDEWVMRRCLTLRVFDPLARHPSSEIAREKCGWLARFFQSLFLWISMPCLLVTTVDLQYKQARLFSFIRGINLSCCWIIFLLSGVVFPARTVICINGICLGASTAIKMLVKLFCNSKKN